MKSDSVRSGVNSLTLASDGAMEGAMSDGCRRRTLDLETLEFSRLVFRRSLRETLQLWRRAAAASERLKVSANEKPALFPPLALLPESFSHFTLLIFNTSHYLMLQTLDRGSQPAAPGPKKAVTESAGGPTGSEQSFKPELCRRRNFNHKIRLYQRRFNKRN